LYACGPARVHEVGEVDRRRPDAAAPVPVQIPVPWPEVLGGAPMLVTLGPGLVRVPVLMAIPVPVPVPVSAPGVAGGADDSRRVRCDCGDGAISSDCCVCDSSILLEQLLGVSRGLAWRR